MSQEGFCHGRHSLSETRFPPIAIADLNGDAKPDLVATTSSSVAVFLQNPAGPGTFLAPTSYGAGLQPISVAVADLDGDNKADLAVANLGSSTDGATASLSVLLQNASVPGSFLAATDYKTNVRSNLAVIADLNGDGNKDIAVANGGGLAVICPPKCGTSGAGVSVFLQTPDTAGHFPAATNYSSDRQVLSVAVADMNGDGRPDLVIANDNGIVIRFQDPANPGQFLSAEAITE
jgi:FG-GAP-like repeat